MNLPKVVIYTDGGCVPNPGKGGWGVVLEFESPARTFELHGYHAQTTNNRMELQAAISALEFLSCKHECIIYSDSTYVVNGAGKNKRKASIPNLNLWHELDTLAKQHHVTWQWVRGHDNNAGNKRADYLATLAIKTQSNGNVAVSSEISDLKHYKAKNSVFIVVSEYGESLNAFSSHKKASDFIEQAGSYDFSIRELEVK